MPAGRSQRRPRRRSDWENLGTAHAGGRRAGAAEPRPRAASGPRTWWRRHRLRVSTVATVLLVLALGSLQVVESYSRWELPAMLATPLVPILLTLLILFFALQSYRQARASLAFHRRFVRPGLRGLLELEGETLSRGEKLFRGHHAVVMKIDVESYTFLTHDMPYGVRRLFLDLWYTMVDDVLARDVFFDKSLGDGSLYLFDAEQRSGACQLALEAAARVRDETVPRFDRLFRERLEERMASSPELRSHAELYFERFRERSGHDFRERRTAVRIALVAGCVDEGLWGLSARSHYDVQGTPLVMATRLEQAAESGEILLDGSFAEALAKELGGMPEGLVARQVELRGIGAQRAWSLPPSAAAPRTAATPSSSPAAPRRAATGEKALDQTGPFELESDAQGAVGL